MKEHTIEIADLYFISDSDNEQMRKHHEGRARYEMIQTLAKRLIMDGYVKFTETVNKDGRIITGKVKLIK